MTYSMPHENEICLPGIDDFRDVISVNDSNLAHIDWLAKESILGWHKLVIMLRRLAAVDGRSVVSATIWYMISV